MSNYFKRLPDFDYVSRLPDAKIGDYIRVKNLFKKGKLREDIFQNLAFFEKYKIKGDDRPDNVAYEVYNDESLDWLVLICNNVINMQSEWPMPQRVFDEYLMNKYGDYETLYNGIHHYETKEVTNSQGVVIVPSGLIIQPPYPVNYFDYYIGLQSYTPDASVAITNYEYEEKIENDKRNIYLLKPRYLNVVFDDLEDIMTYKKGSTQYVSETLKKGDNIKIYS